MKILDVCCGSLMFWYDKQESHTTYMDIRRSLYTTFDRGNVREIEINPDIQADWKHIPFEDETFDLDNIKVTNAAKEYSNGKLYIKYGSEVIKTYTVSSRLKGDINNDDKITIIDVSMLYRHIKKRSIITDQETLLISDINNDGKITIMDVSLLYRYVKGKINEL